MRGDGIVEPTEREVELLFKGLQLLESAELDGVDQEDLDEIASKLYEAYAPEWRPKRNRHHG